MTIDLSKLDRAIAKAKVEINKEVTKVCKKIVIAVDQAVVLSTPVDTGRARGNWLPSLNTRRTDIKQDSTDTSGHGSLSEGLSVVDSFELGDTVFIANNLPYIGALNDGHSKQAPAGFVDKAAQAAVAAVSSSYKR